MKNEAMYYTKIIVIFILTYKLNLIIPRYYSLLLQAQVLIDPLKANYV